MRGVRGTLSFLVVVIMLIAMTPAVSAAGRAVGPRDLRTAVTEVNASVTISDVDAYTSTSSTVQLHIEGRADLRLNESKYRFTGYRFSGNTSYMVFYGGASGDAVRDTDGVLEVDLDLGELAGLQVFECPFSGICIGIPVEALGPDLRVIFSMSIVEKSPSSADFTSSVKNAAGESYTMRGFEIFGRTEGTGSLLGFTTSGAERTSFWMSRKYSSVSYPRDGKYFPQAIQFPCVAGVLACSGGPGKGIASAPEAPLMSGEFARAPLLP